MGLKESLTLSLIYYVIRGKVKKNRQNLTKKTGYDLIESEIGTEAPLVGAFVFDGI